MSPTRKSVALGASAALHVVALAAFVLRPDPPPMPAGAPDVIPVVLVAAPRPAPPPPDFAPFLTGAFDFEAPPPEPAPPAPPPAATVADAAPTPDCRLVDDVRTALQAEAPRAALARIPERRRSVAGAVMLWDGGWVRAGALADPAIARPIRKAVLQAVEAADPACAAASVTGPALLVLPEGEGSLVLVLGSGTWRWSDLAAAAPHPFARAAR